MNPKMNRESTKLIAVVGSRTTVNDEFDKHVGRLVYETLNLGTTPSVPTVYVSGGAASGADAWIRRYAGRYGLKYLEATAFWAGGVRATSRRRRMDPTAGLKRNSTIALVCDELYAFWDKRSPGTRDTIGKFERLGKPINIIDINGIHPLDKMDKPLRPPVLGDSDHLPTSPGLVPRP